MLASWTSNAAYGAHSYFDQLANVIEDRGAILGRLAPVLAGVQELGAALAGALTGAIDIVGPGASPR